MPDGLCSEDLRESLRALRDLLASRLVECEARETAALARQLADVLKALAGLPGEEKSSLDDLAGRRAKRQAAVSDGS